MEGTRGRMRGSPDGNLPSGESKPKTKLRRESAFLRELDLGHLVPGVDAGYGSGSDDQYGTSASDGGKDSGKKKLEGHKIDEGDHYKHHLYGKMASEVTQAVTQNAEIKKQNKELTAQVRVAVGVNHVKRCDVCGTHRVLPAI